PYVSLSPVSTCFTVAGCVTITSVPKGIVRIVKMSPYRADNSAIVQPGDAMIAAVMRRAGTGGPGGSAIGALVTPHPHGVKRREPRVHCPPRRQKLPRRRPRPDSLRREGNDDAKTSPSDSH